MTTYTAIADNEIDAGSPLNASLFYRLARNPQAITEGASGAPKVQTAGLQDGCVTNAKVANASIDSAKIVDGTIVNGDVANGTLGSEKFQASTTETYWVLARYAAGLYCDVGTLIFAATTNDTITVGAGSNIAGSLLKPAGLASDHSTGPLSTGLFGSGASLPGTWRCLGYLPGRLSNNGSNNAATLFVRIS
ncbi:hypothetical protein R5H32_16120 [Defluviimonas sp. D31]|uniref:hypothetical protein n=1 Tax=Defluviimonas sp. D31 TaxID=3083253 RepID=UPI00296EFDE2|nr:hypothetical protein [Defluviimonas sp. D31]MDW4550889.1 hypothetical protein [Defluviimonas sp. D31]